LTEKKNRTGSLSRGRRGKNRGVPETEVTKTQNKQKKTEEEEMDGGLSGAVRTGLKGKWKLSRGKK